MEREPFRRAETAPPVKKPVTAETAEETLG